LVHLIFKLTLRNKIRIKYIGYLNECGILMIDHSILVFKIFKPKNNKTIDKITYINLTLKIYKLTILKNVY